MCMCMYVCCMSKKNQMKKFIVTVLMSVPKCLMLIKDKGILKKAYIC